MADRRWYGVPAADYNVSGKAMSLDLYQDVILTRNLPEQGLCAGDVGTLVDRHVVSGKPEGLSVEFFDMTGTTVAVVTQPASYFRAPTASDRPTARTLTTSSA
jgi:hypothetical protein